MSQENKFKDSANLTLWVNGVCMPGWQYQLSVLLQTHWSTSF